MRDEGSQGKAHPMTRRRMTPPTPLQNSYASLEGERESYEVEGRGWSARESTITARTKQYMERGFSVKVRDVGFRRIMKEARDERGRNIFETSARMVKRFPGGQVVEMGQI